MWYMPYLRVRHAVLVYSCIAAGVTLFAIALRFWPGVAHLDSGDASIRLPLGMIVAAATALVGGFATVLGLNLAAENDGHLELAWTKPASRQNYALCIFAVDIAAMAACIAFTSLCAVVVIDVFAGRQAVGFPSAAELSSALAFFGFPLCVYAWIAALSASLKRNRGGMAALFWPLMIVLAFLTALPGTAIHAVVVALDRFNPISIYFASDSSAHATSMTATLANVSLSALSAAWGWLVAAVLLAAAVVQWRRLEL